MNMLLYMKIVCTAQMYVTIYVYSMYVAICILLIALFLDAYI